MKYSRGFWIITALFITCLLTANIVGVKMSSFSGLILPAAVIIFPLSYIVGDIMTEVYGFRQARQVIWLGFLCNLIFVVIAVIGQILPPAPGWDGQQAYQTILGYTPRLLAASFCGYIAGQFSNSFVLSRMKVLTHGRFLWMRTISSTIIGEGLDSVIYLIGAYYGADFFQPVIILNHWAAKVGIEIVATPITYVVVNYLKKKESITALNEAEV